MERGMILLIAALVVYVAPDVQGTAHLSFANNTTQVNITRDGCGTTKLCVETPGDCDPAATTGGCLFASVAAGTSMAPNGTKLSIELRGYSMGFVAFGLTTNATMGTSMLFICSQNMSNNGSFFFRTRQRFNANNTLMPTERRTKEIVGLVNGNIISCEFDIPNANSSTTRTMMDTNYQIILLNGTYNSSGFGPSVVRLTTPLLNISNPMANIPATTAAPATTMANSGGAVHPHAILSLMSVLTLFVMLRA
ncbi:putative ferric-chelate reductase 1 [Sebastes fasciatus]|uniref:putative ferric-chelate reductase 1 n=1 Tax=Sebastes fasciatus TaxID=394691 RepID=UPI003D9EECD9